MKPPKKVAIIGAGGIACHLAPVLALDHEILFVDGDVFEAKNSSRQWPALHEDGVNANKATYLAELTQVRAPNQIFAIDSYLEGPSIINNPAWDGVDFIFGCVDNNQSRRLIIDLCDRIDVPAILCGNETAMGEAHLVLPGRYDPFDLHDFGPMTKAPFSCTSDENQESAPQTSHANFLAAAAGIHIFMSFIKQEAYTHMVVHSRLDVRSDSTRTRLSDYDSEIERMLRSAG